jgi:hypothetical protein
MANGLFFYKLVSPYSNDTTKNCKLTINEIDSNFFTLEERDIASAEFVRDEKVLVLTRLNGEKLVVDLSSVTYDLDVSAETSNSGMTLMFTYDGADGKKSIKIDNVMTSDTVKTLIKEEINSKDVVTDGTLTGTGNLSHPLGVKRTEATGNFAPAISLIDITRGGSLPTVASLGTRYVTKEYVSDYGYLYNGCGLSKIAASLEGNLSGWRVPTKKDWDDLLNSIEPCEYKNHTSAKCHVDLGKFAGKLLKSECGWLGEPDCTCDGTVPQTASTSVSLNDDYTEYDVNCGCNIGGNDEETPSEKPISPNGVDSYGFRILPSGIATLNAYGKAQASRFKEKSIFWSSSHVNDDVHQDTYVKEFDWAKTTVLQSAECDKPYYSIRLVKDYTGSNNFGAEYVNGTLYKTILHAQSGQVWLATNYASIEGLNGESASGCSDYALVNNGQIEDKRKEFFINEWNGTAWEKKLLGEGDSIVVENPIISDSHQDTITVKWVDSKGDEHCVDVEVPSIAQHNVEYRVFTSESNCDKVLLNTDDLAVERIVNIMIPILEAEREERIEADERLSERIDAEVAARTEGDEALQDALDAEIAARVEGDEALQDALDAEAAARTEGDESLRNALNDEIERSTSKDEEIEGQLIVSDKEYIIKVNDGLSLELKNGRFIEIGFDGNYGEI